MTLVYIASGKTNGADHTNGHTLFHTFPKASFIPEEIHMFDISATTFGLSL